MSKNILIFLSLLKNICIFAPNKPLKTLKNMKKLISTLLFLCAVSISVNSENATLLVNTHSDGTTTSYQRSTKPRVSSVNGSGKRASTTVAAKHSSEAIDLGLSVKWASCNVGASSPEGYGGYYAWGETEEKRNYSLKTYKYYDSSTGYIDIGSNISGTQYDVAHVKWGGNWRMPTQEEFQELCSKCKSTWTTYKGVYGRKFIGPNGNSIFLPAAGYRWDTLVDDRGSHGFYRSGTIYSGDSCNAWYLDFDDGFVDPYSEIRFFGYSVRPVSKQ